ncbi:hypothetical protein ACIQXF_10220 [Lysinibacillus sp. NPDC097231]|uniref:hypothetical protein n=1 Tax=Lysinibacillus sp. NPDC097231 TaxID=3364142 RepID=UPI00381B1919
MKKLFLLPLLSLFLVACGNTENEAISKSDKKQPSEEIEEKRVVTEEEKAAKREEIIAKLRENARYNDEITEPFNLTPSVGYADTISDAIIKGEHAVLSFRRFSNTQYYDFDNNITVPGSIIEFSKYLTLYIDNIYIAYDDLSTQYRQSIIPDRYTEEGKRNKLSTNAVLIYEGTIVNGFPSGGKKGYMRPSLKIHAEPDTLRYDLYRNDQSFDVVTDEQFFFNGKERSEEYVQGDSNKFYIVNYIPKKYLEKGFSLYVVPQDNNGLSSYIWGSWFSAGSMQIKDPDESWAYGNLNLVSESDLTKMHEAIYLPTEEEIDQMVNDELGIE